MSARLFRQRAHVHPVQALAVEQKVDRQQNDRERREQRAHHAVDGAEHAAHGRVGIRRALEQLLHREDATLQLMIDHPALAFFDIPRRPFPQVAGLRDKWRDDDHVDHDKGDRGGEIENEHRGPSRRFSLGAEPRLTFEPGDGRADAEREHQAEIDERECAAHKVETPREPPADQQRGDAKQDEPSYLGFSH